jgi:hypothetical protein
MMPTGSTALATWATASWERNDARGRSPKRKRGMSFFPSLALRATIPRSASVGTAQRTPRHNRYNPQIRRRRRRRNWKSGNSEKRMQARFEFWRREAIVEGRENSSRQYRGSDWVVLALSYRLALGVATSIFLRAHRRAPLPVTKSTSPSIFNSISSASGFGPASVSSHLSNRIRQRCRLFFSRKPANLLRPPLS